MSSATASRPIHRLGAPPSRVFRLVLLFRSARNQTQDDMRELLAGPLLARLANELTRFGFVREFRNRPSASQASDWTRCELETAFGLGMSEFCLGAVEECRASFSLGPKRKLITVALELTWAGARASVLIIFVGCAAATVRAEMGLSPNRIGRHQQRSRLLQSDNSNDDFRAHFKTRRHEIIPPEIANKLVAVEGDKKVGTDTKEMAIGARDSRELQRVLQSANSA